MRFYFRLLFIICGLIFCSQTTNATHIVGGDFSYKHISGDTYEMKMKMYRDCDGSPLDDEITVSIFDKVTNQRKLSIRMPRVNIYIIQFNTFCINPELRCVQTGVFLARFNMPASIFNNMDGYYVSWERCCRNNIIKNIVNPGGTAMAFYMEFPSPYPNGGSQFINNSPEFTRDPLNYLCVGEAFQYDFKTVDLDGDELRFSLITPLAGGNTSPNNPRPVSVAGPYDEVIWRNGYGPSTGNFIDGNPNLTVQADKAILYINPTQIGVYVISVLCEEFRDNVKIGEIRRELQLEVIQCPPRSKPVLTSSLANNIMLFTVGQQGCFDLNGLDGDLDETLRFRIDTLGMHKLFSSGATLNPSDASGLATVNTQFCWTPICPIDTSNGSFIDFILYDNSCPFTQEDTVRVQFEFQTVPNEIPKINTNLPSNIFNVKINEPNCFQINGTDLNATDQISILTNTRGTNLFNLGATLPQIIIGQQSISAEFCWTPDCSTVIDTGTYLEFIISDNACPHEALDTILVKVNIMELANDAPLLEASGINGSNVEPDGTIHATIGEPVCAIIIGTDNDIEDDLDLYLQNVNYDFLANGATFRLVDQVPGLKQYEFCWTPTCDNFYAGSNLSIDFLIRDNKCLNEKFDTTRLKVVYDLPPNDLPSIIKPDSIVYHLNAGYPQSVDVTGLDPDFDDFMILSAEAMFPSTEPIRIEFQTVEGNDSISSQLNVFPDCGINSNQDYFVRFKLLSNKFCNEYDTTYRTVAFRVNPLEQVEKPYVPNVFSPNGDGVNDLFKIYLSDRTICPDEFSIQIFDRWGKILFESKDPEFAWAAQDIAAGAYIYVIKIADEPITGFIALVK